MRERGRWGRWGEKNASFSVRHMWGGGGGGRNRSKQEMIKGAQREWRPSKRGGGGSHTGEIYGGRSTGKGEQDFREARKKSCQKKEKKNRKRAKARKKSQLKDKNRESRRKGCKMGEVDQTEEKRKQSDNRNELRWGANYPNDSSGDTKQIEGRGYTEIGWGVRAP